MTLPLLTRSSARRRIRRAGWESSHLVVLFVTDLVVLVATVAAAFSLSIAPVWAAGNAHPDAVAAALLIVGAWLSALLVGRAYDPRMLAIGSEEFKRVFDAAIRTSAIVGLFAFLTQLDVPPRFVASALATGTAVTLLSRYVARKMLHRRTRSGAWGHRVLAVGSRRVADELATELARVPQVGLRIVGHWTPHGRADLPEPEEESGSLLDAIAAWRADTVAVAGSSGLSPDELRRLAWQLEGTDVDLIVASNLTNVSGPRIHMRPIAGLPLLHVDTPDLAGGGQFVKAVFDRASAAILLLLLSPLLIGVAVLIKVTSDGPALFWQHRLGRDAVPFRICKFRTMYDGADARFLDLVSNHDETGRGGLFVKDRQDPRVTPIGSFLRRLSLDELPQLINVLRGEMSLVGPRPLPVQVAQDGHDVRRRLLVRPGMTGLWQVSGRSDLPWEEAVRLDLYYVENWSLAFDFMIMWKTARVVLRGGGAY